MDEATDSNGDTRVAADPAVMAQTLVVLDCLLAEPLGDALPL